MTEPPSTPQGSGPDWGEMSGKIKAATGADRLILIAGLLFVVDSFLPWYGGCVSAGTAKFCVNITGWGSKFWAILSILFAIGAFAFALIRVTGVKVSLGTKNDGLAYLILGGGAFLFALLRFLTETSGTRFGLYFAIALGAVLAYGGFQKYKGQAA